MKIVAEIGASHCGSRETASTLIRLAKWAGADAVKLQTWSVMAHPGYEIPHGPWKGKDLAALYEYISLPWDWQKELFAEAFEQGIECFSSVFDLKALEFLESLNCPRYKIASFEAIDLRLIREVAATRKPMIISTGMASRREVLEAVSAAKNAGCDDLTLLQCTSSYPAKTVDIKEMLRLKDVSGCEVGISDHTVGIGVSVAAVVMGASVVEKHIKHVHGGEDDAFAMDAIEFKRMVDSCRQALEAMDVCEEPDESSSRILRRSLYLAKDVKAGDVLMDDDVVTLRPALGLHPRELSHIVGMRVMKDAKVGTPVTDDILG